MSVLTFNSSRHFACDCCLRLYTSNAICSLFYVCTVRGLYAI